MTSFPKELKFKKIWRVYQARILSEIDEHLDDNHLNVIAAPGSGKTVLGLEIILHLNQPTLILSPTLAIRDQWIERLREFYLEGAVVPDWVTKDIKQPRLMTVATYQALHSAYAGINDDETEEPEEENGPVKTEDAPQNPSAESGKRINVAKLLKEAGVRTLVVDEAHHLRSEWWKTLSTIKAELESVKVVALTATPPYDSTPLEWERYQSFCGAVDAEISVPELVLEGNLCPHQDHIYFSKPSIEEKTRIDKFRQEVKSFTEELVTNAQFIAAIEGHPLIHDPKKHIDQILGNPEYFSSIAIFLHHMKKETPRMLLNSMGLSKRKLPPLTDEWLEILLTGCLYADSETFLSSEILMKEIRQRLSRMGAVERRQVTLRTTREISKLFTLSVSKLKSITEIVQIESQGMGQELRMVILTDFIRQADMPKNPEDLKPLNRLGVVPIYEAIRRMNFKNIKLGILSGSIVLIPKESESLFKELAREWNVDLKNLDMEQTPHDENYLLIKIQGKDREQMVRLVTELFTRGGITVLVGTKSLLGEGWDAPSVNTLVLASFVGTYMLSNQMRGRAIRSLAGQKEKTANIWHLVCVEQATKIPGDDWETLSRRFKAFVGVGSNEAMIENGIERLNLGNPPFPGDRILSINQFMQKSAIDRDGLRRQWAEALKKGQDGVRLRHEIKAPTESLPRGFVFYKTLTALFWEGIFIGGHIFSGFLQGLGNRKTSVNQALTIVAIGFAVSALAALPNLLKALWLFIKHGPVESSIKQIGEALLKAMCFTGIIKTDVNKLIVKAGKDKQGFVHCSLEGGTSYEKSIFLDAFQEILSPIANPRYIILRKTILGRIGRVDYHSVPQALGAKNTSAEYFHKMWKKYVGDSSLIFTRNTEGRAELLRAREHSLSAGFQRRSEQINCWK